MNQDQLQVDQKRLAEAWSRTLPQTLNASDRARVLPDEAEPHSLRVHIDTAGRSMYSFDFKVTYVDSREIRVDLVDVEQDNRTINEHSEIVQNLTEDYVRHLHETAQVLHEMTHS